jgi:sigma-B regulation protein RsbU (phosphoserine phosphatase)
MTYCNAGHNPPLLLKRNGRLLQLRPTGAAIGLIEQTSFQQEKTTMEKGDSLLLYTDGVVESANEAADLFGEERLEEFMRNSSSLSAQQTISFLREKIQSFTGTTIPSDDTTIIALKGS